MRSTQRLWSQAAAVAAPVSSEMEVMLGGGKEYTAVEAKRPHCSHYSRQSRHSHCSQEIQQQRPTVSTSTASSSGNSGASSSEIWALIFLFLKK
jgi:hypothetical protein